MFIIAQHKSVMISGKTKVDNRGSGPTTGQPVTHYIIPIVIREVATPCGNFNYSLLNISKEGLSVHILLIPI